MKALLLFPCFCFFFTEPLGVGWGRGWGGRSRGGCLISCPVTSVFRQQHPYNLTLMSHGFLGQRASFSLGETRSILTVRVPLPGTHTQQPIRLPAALKGQWDTFCPQNTNGVTGTACDVQTYVNRTQILY